MIKKVILDTVQYLLALFVHSLRSRVKPADNS